MSSFDLKRERDSLNARLFAGEITMNEYDERFNQALANYREALQRARQEDAPGPEEEDDER